MSEYPEHAKLQAVSDESQAQGEFIEWLKAEGYHLCVVHDNEFIPTVRPINQLLAQYHSIDLVEIEKEAQQMLNELHTEFIERLKVE